MQKPTKNSDYRQSGNIFFALFGAVALVAILGGAVMTFMKGPLATSVRVTRQNTAETQMMIGAQVAVMASANTASSGDCDSDGYVEPLEWRDAGALAAPAGGGLIPMSIGISKKDPWGTEYGYCAWDHGTSSACDDETGAGDNPAERLGGAATGGAYPVVALISAGQDKVFTTTCRDFAAADVDSDGALTSAVDLPLVSKAAETDDDIIFTYTYDEATGASGGLWSIKSGDPDTAVINKKIETSGTASFQGGVLLPDSSLITCDPTTAGVMARNASGGIDICDGAGSWDQISGGGASNTFNADNTVACDGTTVGQVRYNATTELPEFCNGTDWLPFTINIPGINLVLSPQQQNGMNVDGAANVDPSISGVCDDGIYYCGNPVDFTLVNAGTLQSSVVALSLTNTTNFYIKAQTCTVAGGNADGRLDPNESCTITVIPKSSGNTTYSGNLQVNGDNNPFAIIQGSSTGFGCVPGRVGPGGKYASCNVSGLYDLVVTPGGCSGTPTNPTCSGTDYVTFTAANSWGQVPWFYEDFNGAQMTVDMMSFANMSGSGLTYPAASYCYNLIYGGYDDWYLPADFEYRDYIYPNKGVIGGFSTATNYWSSTIPNSASKNRAVSMSDGWAGDVDLWYNYRVRCARREGQALPAARSDKNPKDVSITPSISFSSGGTASTPTVTVSEINQPINVSITGGTGMDIIKNGASTGSDSITGVTWGDTLAFTMDAPTVLGTKNTATITIGTDTYTWWVGYADSSKTAHVFVTSTTYGGNLGGLSGADSICNNHAASSSLALSSQWKAIISDDSTSAKARIPWSWGILKLVDDTTVVANNFGDLWDGTLAAPISKDQNGSAKSVGVLSGTKSNGDIYTGGYTANNWTNDSGACEIGYSSSSNTGWVEYGIHGLGGWTCQNSGLKSIYCIEDVDSVSDTTPKNLTIPYKIQVPASSRQSSDAVVIGGMSAGATATLSVTATGGTPTFTVNGGAEVTSASVSNGDSVVFYMDAPASDNSSNKMTITANGVTTLGYWRVWSGDSTGTAVKRVFVTSSTYWMNVGGVLGADSRCQSAADGAALGGTWKAIVSGITEPDYAINRVGYNWSFLNLVDGTTTVTTAGNLWKTSITPFINPITKTQSGANVSNYYVITNTFSNGLPRSTSTDGYSCYNFTSSSDTTNAYAGINSVTTTGWTSQGNYWGGCYNQLHLYCIEQ